MSAPKYNFGNYPNSASYDSNVPIGTWKWDDEPEEEKETYISQYLKCDDGDLENEEEEDLI